MSTAETAARPTRARNRRGEGARLREEIIDAAQELLDETGDERAITLRSVARKVGIAAPSIYPHFADQPAIMLAVVLRAFEELTAELRAAAESTDDPPARLRAVCHAYLDFGVQRPERYRTMFGGLWMPSIIDNSLTEEDLDQLGAEAMRILATALADCATGRDPAKDAVALWLGMHGLAHQRIITRYFPWPDDIEDRLIDSLAHLPPAR